MIVHVARFRLPIVGVLHLAATASGVVWIHLADDDRPLRAGLARRFPSAELRRGNDATADAGRSLRRYLEGGEDPDVEVVLPERGFSSRVWRQLRRIPRGQVRSYARVARALGSPGASRAVGQACGGNPVPLIVPCHRVVSSDGGLGGFGGGVEMKRRLLELEGIRRT